MRAFFVCGAVAAAVVALFAQAQGPAPAADPLLRAMREELERSRKLAFPNVAPPYFVQYVIDVSDSFRVSASQGGLVSRNRQQFRSPDIEVRVGDYKFDNTNYAGAGSGGSRYDLGNFPIDDSNLAMRRHLWLLTDASYKTAVEAISRKRAALRNVTQNDQLNDFAKAEPVRYSAEIPRLKVDEDAWTNRVRTLSAQLGHHKELASSSVDFEAGDGGYYVVNSEGTEVRERESVTYLRARATAMAPDGMTARDSITFHALDSAHLPSEAEMSRGLEAMAQNVTALAHATVGEEYNGPVLFEGVAGAQLFAELLGRNLAPLRRPVTERPSSFTGAELEGRIGARVLPESFDVVDDPSVKEWRGRQLFGSYAVDREGVPAKPLRLVEKGVLRNYLLTRQPVRGFEGSNGRARAPGSYGASGAATISNLFVTSTESAPLPELRKKLIELIRARGNNYGIIVRKMDFPSAASLDEARRIIGASQGSRAVSVPLLIYKVFPDGREEMVRGLRFRGLSARSLRDILAAGNDEQAFDYMENGAPFALIGASTYFVEACVVAPSVLIDDLELQRIEEQYPKLPLVPPPDLGR